MAKRRSVQSSPPPSPPSLPPDKSIILLTRQRDAGVQMLATPPVDENQFRGWKNTTHEFLIQAFGAASQNVFAFGSAGSFMGFIDATEQYYQGKRAEALQKQLSILDSALEQLEATLELQPPQELAPEPTPPLELVEHILAKFHLVAHQLRSRHAGRPTLEVNDEYDVQDLMHGLLRIFFEDIRPEEWTPSYAGGSSRMDFLLKAERLVIEVKKSRPTLSVREIGEQLIIDIARYKAHPECDTLICFVYDPEGLVSNPRGLERDLSRKEPQLLVKVLVAPKGL